LALLKVDGGPFPRLELAGNNLPPVGSRVFAIGSPVGRINSISEGIVSGHQPLVVDTGIVAIQTTAAISHGSSGGPLFADDGKVVGITSQSVPGGQSLNLAVPVERLARLLPVRGPLQSLASAGGQPLAGDNGAAELKEVWEAIKTRDFVQALHLLNALPSSQKKASPQYWFAIGFVQGEMGNHEFAVDAYKSSIRLDPSRAFSHCNLGISLGHLRRYSEATESFRTAVALKPDFAIAYYYCGVAFFNLGQYASAIGPLKTVVALEPKRVGAHSLLGRSYGQIRRYEDAIECFRKAVDSAPDDADTHFWLGMALKDDRAFADASKSFQKAVEINPRFAIAHLQLGEVHLEQGGKGSSKADILEGIRLIERRNDVNSSTKQFAKQILVSQLDHRAKALRHLQRAAELDPNGQVGKNARSLIVVVAK
jgi:tetratricopeptide (TPR) repeat protein